MRTLPTGTVTFLFTDIEGSTALWETRPEAMQASLRRHDEILSSNLDNAGGIVFKTVGDAFCAVFPSGPAAAAAAIAIQESLIAEAWTGPPLRVRIGLHTGEAECRDQDYFGPALNRVARLMSAGHGGQVLLSQSTFSIVQDRLPEGAVIRSLGIHRLKDLQRAEEIFQLSSAGLRSEFPPLRTLATFPNNLPVQLTSFIGREDSLAEVRSHLESTHLLTLAGSGGAGKTRLALQAAAERLEEFADGVWFVELAAITDPERVAETTARTLGLQEGGSQPVAARLEHFMRDRKILLLLDNCEHLLDACAPLVATLLQAGPGLRIIATSREPLGVAGETTMRVPSLSLPEPSGAAVTAESVQRSEAGMLFLARARAVDPHFEVRDADAPAVDQICTRLDGMPLAIELAAARVKVLTVSQIAARLDDRFRLLTGGSRTALPRQQTLLGAIDWSYQLLTDEERRALRRLSVFVGGWTLEAAEAVCEGAISRKQDALDVLTRLVERSLVVFDREPAARYRLLQTVRQYAGEKLAEARETESAQDAHLAWCVEFAQDGFREDLSRASLEWLQRLDLEDGNLMAAIERARTAVDRSPALMHLVANLGYRWAMKGRHLAEGPQWAQEALLRSTEDGRLLRARVLTAAAYFPWVQGDAGRAHELFREAVALAREADDSLSLGWASYGLGMASWRMGAIDEARSVLVEALGIVRKLNTHDGPKPAGAVEHLVLTALGVTAMQQGDLDDAEALFLRSLSIAREHGVAQTWALGALGEIARMRKDWDAAIRYYTQTRDSYIASGNEQMAAVTTSNLARVARNLGDWAEAARGFGQALATMRRIGSSFATFGFVAALGGVALLAGQPEAGARALGAGQMHERQVDPADKPEEDRDRDELLRALGEEKFALEYRRGQAMTEHEALAFAESLVDSILNNCGPR